MGKKKERSVGCVLIADHRKTHKRRDPKKDSWLHTTEMDELPYPGYDAKLDKLKSCTEQVGVCVVLLFWMDRLMNDKFFRNDLV